MDLMQSKESDNFIRPPIITIMGHVDHGKTSLLDYIRKTKVAEKEAGGITQSIGAYQILHKTRKITFIDTPGHAAFTKMRLRGGRAADIVVLVVSVVDGVQPQTKESISIIKETKTPLIVALNKSDLPGANPEKVKKELAESDVLVETWGGDVISCEVSAKTGLGVDKLIESIVTLADLIELKANPNGDLEGLIIESRLDQKKGPLFTGIVKNGTLRVGLEVYSSKAQGKVKALVSYNGEQLKEALPGDPVEVLGFSHAPRVGDVFVDIKNKDLVELSDGSGAAKGGFASGVDTCNVILKADTEGSLEALEYSIDELIKDNLPIRIISKSTGDVNESDVLMAESSKAVILGFNSKVPGKVLDLSENLKVKVKTYKIIYELIETLKDVIAELMYKEEVKVKGRAQVLQTFTLASGDIVAGSKVLAGSIKNISRVSVFREGIEQPVYTGKVKSVRRGRDEVSSVGRDNDCGILLKPVFKDIKPQDIIEVI